MATIRTPISLSLLKNPKLSPPNTSKTFFHPASVSNFLSISLKSHLRFNHLPLKPYLRHFLRTSKPPKSAPGGGGGGGAVKSLFTGIVEEMSQVQHVGPSHDGGFEMRIVAKTVLGGVQLGDSIAVNGTCLTVSHFDLAASNFTVGLSPPETLRKTNLGDLVPGLPVNLERAFQPTSTMGGHFVQGHVDGTGEIVSLESEGDSLWVKVRAPPELLRLVVPKGFIAVDGTSLTVVGIYEKEKCFDFMLVAYTKLKVVIPLKKLGDKVNLEVDILGKYIEKLLRSGLTSGASASSS